MAVNSLIANGRSSIPDCFSCEWRLCAYPTPGTQKGIDTPRWKWRLIPQIGETSFAVHFHLQLLDVRKSEDLAPAFDAASKQGVDALVVIGVSLMQRYRELILELVAKHRLPTIYPAREFVDAGGLMFYAIDYDQLYYRAASLLDRIFKGAKPADLPVEQPTMFELVVNLETAKVLGLTIPQSLLPRANEVIE